MRIINDIKVIGFEFKDSNDLLFASLEANSTEIVAVEDAESTILICNNCSYANNAASAEDAWTELDNVTVFARTIEVEGSLPENCVCYGVLVTKLEGTEGYGITYAIHNAVTGEETWYNQVNKEN